ncbi:uncharacterized protein E6C27_scaffold36G001500 [Cucumis melo var. makuwa]|uniref:Uncharacterized protein n=1 Tax=Cucumis melo var. makuwa TaxID=1194695 RepID=A0A5A7T8P4_CUCMM|nr:uncharacterized protein E6C27_scaffold36G001500 [Cucumis melo var. makuwa]
MLPRRGACRGGGGGRGRRIRRDQPERHLVVQVANPTAPITHADLVAIDKAIGLWSSMMKNLTCRPILLLRWSTEAARGDKFVISLRLDFQGLVRTSGQPSTLMHYAW